MTVDQVKVASTTSKASLAQQKYIVVEQPTTSKQVYTFSNGTGDKVTYTSNEAVQGIHKVTVADGVANSDVTVSDRRPFVRHL